MAESVEKIKNRMLQNAAKSWGYSDTEAEESFDPLVSLLIDVCANELHKNSQEIDSSRARIIERMVKLLSPEVITGIYPSHAIAKAKSVNPSHLIKPEHQFFVIKNIPNPLDPVRPIQKEIYFSPTADYKVFNAEVNYIATTEKLHTINQNGVKALIEQNKNISNRGTTTKMWVALKKDQSVKNLQGITFFFDYKTEYNKKLFFHHLHNAKIKVGGQNINYHKGYNIQQSVRSINSIEAIVKKEYRTADEICNHVNYFYENQFVTIEDDLLKINNWDQVPTEIAEKFNPKNVDKLDESIWIEFQFSSAIDVKLIDNFDIHINAFPVVNRKLNEFFYKTQEYLNIVPLIAEEYFLDINSITDTEGNPYHIKIYSTDTEERTAILRNGGVGRFDARTASEQIQYLIELLKDEGAAFSALGRDYLSNNLKKLNQILSSLEEKSKQKAALKENTHYLMFESEKAYDNIHIEFWTSDGEIANEVKAKTKLNIAKGGGFVNNQITFITSAVGGREKLSVEDRLNAYRLALLSRDRIVSEQDIKTAAIHHFGALLKEVSIEKGYYADPALGGGYTRSINIYLEPNNDNGIEHNQWDYLCDDFEVLLKEKSSISLPFQLFKNIQSKN